MNFKKVMVGTLAGAMLASMSVVPVSAADSYNCYIGFQTANYSFRNAWDDGTYGLAGETDFNTINGWKDNERVDREGTITDALNITADGEYTVSVSGLNWEDGIDFPATNDTYNLLFVSTDIPIDMLDDENFSFEIKSVTADGTALAPTVIDNYEDSKANYINESLLNIWSDNTTLNGLTSATKEIKITFEIKGLFGSDASGDVAPVAYLAAIVAVAGIAMVASKKRA